MPKGIYIGNDRPKSEEARRKMSLARKGIKLSEDHKRHIGEASKRLGLKPPSNIGKHLSLETRKKIGDKQRGEKNHNFGKKSLRLTLYNKARKGYKHTEETKIKMSESHKGKKCYLWKGGISSETNKRTHTFEWNKIRRQVYRRDNWTCQICGNNKIKVHAHHIVPYRISQDNSLGNLITLCNSCHGKEEHKYYSLLVCREISF